MSLYHILENTEDFISVHLTDLFIKRNKGILFSLVGMSFSGTYQDWYLTCRGGSTFLKHLTEFSYSLSFWTSRIQLQEFLNGIQSPTSGNRLVPSETSIHFPCGPEAPTSRAPALSLLTWEEMETPRASYCRNLKFRCKFCMLNIFHPLEVISRTVLYSCGFCQFLLIETRLSCQTHMFFWFYVVV